MKTYEVVEHAVGKRAVQVAQAMGCHLSWLYRQCQPARGVRGRDLYLAFWKLVKACWQENRTGAELIIADFNTRVARLRNETYAAITSGEFHLQLARCSDENGDVMRVVFQRGGYSAVRREAAEAIAAYQALDAMAYAREQQQIAVRRIASRRAA